MPDDTSIDQLPDLPELEEVQTLDRAYLPVLLIHGLFTGSMAVAICWLFTKYREFIPLPAQIMVWVVIACMAWLLVRILLAYTSFRTDRLGITLRGPLRKRFIRWIEITSASGDKGKLALLTSQGRVVLNARGFGTDPGDSLIASVWQHLRRLGRADAIQLTDRSRTLWEPIPEDVPPETEWGKPSRANVIGLIICFLLLIAPIPCLWIGGPPKPGMLMLLGVLLAGIVILFKALLIPAATCEASWAAVREDGIEATALGTTCIPWSQVTAAWWLRGQLAIRADNPRREIWLPYRLGDKQREQLILCAIRQLRTAGRPQAVPIPDLVLLHPEVYRKQAWSSQQAAVHRQAYLRTLDEPVRRKMNRLYGFVVVSVIIGFAAGFALVFSDLTAKVSRALFATPQTRLFMPANSLVVAAPLFFGAMLLIAGASQLVANRLASPHQDEWKEVSRIGTGKIDAAITRILVILVVPSLLLVPLTIDCYARFTDDGIAMNRFLSYGERFYPWRDVRSVRVIVDNDRSCPRYTYSIRFADGTGWSVKDGDYPGSYSSRMQRAVEFTARKSGKPLERVYD